MKTTPEMTEVMQAYCDRWNLNYVDYRIKKQTKKVELLAWFTGDSIFWTTPLGNANNPTWKRVPSEDKIIEVEL